MVPRDPDIGFQGLALIQGQIYNPEGECFSDGWDVFFGCVFLVERNLPQDAFSMCSESRKITTKPSLFPPMSEKMQPDGSLITFKSWGRHPSPHTPWCFHNMGVSRGFQNPKNLKSEIDTLNHTNDGPEI